MHILRRADLLRECRHLPCLVRVRVRVRVRATATARVRVRAAIFHASSRSAFFSAACARSESSCTAWRHAASRALPAGSAAATAAAAAATAVAAATPPSRPAFSTRAAFSSATAAAASSLVVPSRCALSRFAAAAAAAVAASAPFAASSSFASSTSSPCRATRPARARPSLSSSSSSSLDVASGSSDRLASHASASASSWVLARTARRTRSQSTVAQSTLATIAAFVGVSTAAAVCAGVGGAERGRGGTGVRGARLERRDATGELLSSRNPVRGTLLPLLRPVLPLDRGFAGLASTTSLVVGVEDPSAIAQQSTAVSSGPGERTRSTLSQSAPCAAPSPLSACSDAACIGPKRRATTHGPMRLLLVRLADTSRRRGYIDR